MTHDLGNDADATAAQGGSEGKRRYQKPRILAREPLEAVAAVCSPSPPAKTDGNSCPSGPFSS